MAAKKRLRMRGVKQSPKRLEDELLDRSRKIADSPGLLRPMCAGKCRKCAFDKPFKNIEAISTFKHDSDALMKYASKGSDDLSKAYAGTVSLSAVGKIPMLATASIAGEKVAYVVRGAVGNDKLIGCQYYNNPKLRLFFYNSFIKRNKLHLYSFEDGIVCSNVANMPEDYLYESFWNTPYEFTDDALTCGHESAVALEIKIKSLNEIIHICDDCAKDVSTIQFLISTLCALDPLDDFEVNVIHKYYSSDETGNEKIEGAELKKYLRGEVNDRTLLQNIKRSKLGSLKDNDDATYLIGIKNYGSDLDSFISDISGSDLEKDIIKRFLEGHSTSLILKYGKTSEILSIIWEENWRDLIALRTSDEFAKNIANRPKNPPLQSLNDSYREYISIDIVASLPAFDKPRPVTKLADTLAKASKVGGVDMVKDAIASETLKNSTMRALSASFVLACDSNVDLPLSLTTDEKEFADFLIHFSKSLIDADGDKYKETMNTLLTACSSGESV